MGRQPRSNLPAAGPRAAHVESFAPAGSSSGSGGGGSNSNSSGVITAGGVRIDNNALGNRVPLNNFSVRQTVRHSTPVDSTFGKRTLKEYLSGALNPFGLTLDVWAYKRSQLYSLVVAAFEKLHLLTYLNISQQEFVAFVVDVDRGYFDNPYHSFLHGFDIFQIVHYVLIDLHGDFGMTKLDLLGILIAALCHDLAHPGVNNLYQVHASTKLAIMYNDISVLENYSCSMTFALAAKHGIFRHLSQKDYEAVRSIIIKAILATDISLHFDLREKFTSFVDSYDRSQGPPDAEHKPLILNAILHMADVSNPARPWVMAKRWSDMVVEEFFLQGDLEKLNNLAPSPNMDRDKTLQPQIALGFQDFIVQPFVNIVSRYLPSLSVFTDYLTENRVQWQALLEQMKRQAAPGSAGSADMAARDAAQLILKQRRLSVASGTVTIPGNIVARLSPRTVLHGRTPSVSSIDRVNESDDDTSVDGIYPWFPELDASIARELTASVLQEPALLSQKQAGMTFTGGSRTASPNPSRRSLYTETERLLAKSVCMLQLSTMVLQDARDDPARYFVHVPQFFKKVFAAHSVMLAVLSKSHERLQYWLPHAPKSPKHAPLDHATQSPTSPLAAPLLGDGDGRDGGTMMKRHMLVMSPEVIAAFRAAGSRDNGAAADEQQAKIRAFPHVQRPGHRLVVPIMRPKGFVEPVKKRQSLVLPDGLPAAGSDGAGSPLQGTPPLPPSVTKHVVGVIDIYRLTAFGPAEMDMAACLADVLAPALARAHFQSLTLKKERKGSGGSDKGKRSPDHDDALPSGRGSLDLETAAA